MLLVGYCCLSRRSYFGDELREPITLQVLADGGQTNISTSLILQKVLDVVVPQLDLECIVVKHKTDHERLVLNRDGARTMAVAFSIKMIRGL